MFNERPPEIKKSIKTGNTEHLRAAGRKGALAMHEKREREKTIAEITAELREEELLLGAEEARLQRGGDPED